MRILKEALLKEYGSFADKRIKNIDKGSTFVIDDRTDRDFGSDGLYGYFCMMFAEVVSDTEVLIRLYGNVPKGAPVSAWEAAEGLSRTESELAFSVSPANIARLTDLAAALRAIVAPGAQRYDTSNYKYVCPRTAGSLERLARALQLAWQV